MLEVQQQMTHFKVSSKHFTNVVECYEMLAIYSQTP
jgi:hypothetical protein